MMHQQESALPRPPATFPFQCRQKFQVASTETTLFVLCVELRQWSRSESFHYAVRVEKGVDWTQSYDLHFILSIHIFSFHLHIFGSQIFKHSLFVSNTPPNMSESTPTPVLDPKFVYTIDYHNAPCREIKVEFDHEVSFSTPRYQGTVPRDLLPEVLARSILHQVVAIMLEHAILGQSDMVQESKAVVINRFWSSATATVGPI
jgi:hypothetical protein